MKSAVHARAAVLLALAACALAVCCMLGAPGQAQAAAYQSSRAVDVTTTVAGKTFEAVQYQNDKGWYVCQITMTQNGSTKTLVDGADAAFVTNGKYLYYAKVTAKLDDGWSYKQKIYRLTITSGAKKKLASGINYIPAAAYGSYLYYGSDQGPEGINLYAMNVKTKKKRHMVDVVGSVKCGSGRVVTTTNTGDAGNYPMNVFKKDGNKRKMFAKGFGAKIKGKKIIFGKLRYQDGGHIQFRVYKCSLSGKGKKAITDWLDKYPEEYLG